MISLQVMMLSILLVSFILLTSSSQVSDDTPRDSLSSGNSFLELGTRVFTSRAGKALVEQAIRDVDAKSIARSLLEQESQLRTSAQAQAQTEASSAMEVESQTQAQARSEDEGENPTQWWPGRTEFNEAFNEAASAIGTNAKSDGETSGEGENFWWLKNAPWFLPPPPEWGPIKQEMYAGYYNKPVHRSFELPNVAGKPNYQHLPNPAATAALTAPGPLAPQPYVAIARPDAFVGTGPTIASVASGMLPPTAVDPTMSFVSPLNPYPGRIHPGTSHYPDSLPANSPSMFSGASIPASVIGDTAAMQSASAMLGVGVDQHLPIHDSPHNDALQGTFPTQFPSTAYSQNGPPPFTFNGISATTIASGATPLSTPTSTSSSPSFLASDDNAAPETPLQPKPAELSRIPDSYNPSALETAASGAYPSPFSPQSRPVGLGTDNVYLEPFRGDYGSRLVQPLPTQHMVGPSLNVENMDPRATTLGDLTVDYGIYQQTTQHTLGADAQGQRSIYGSAEAGTGVYNGNSVGMEHEEGADIYTSTHMPYTAASLLGQAQPNTLDTFRGSMTPSAATMAQNNGHLSPSASTSMGYMAGPRSPGSLINTPYVMNHIAPQDPAINPVPGMMAPPGAGSPRVGSLFSMINADSGNNDGGYEQRTKEMVDLNSGMRLYPDNGLNNLNNPNLVMHSPMHSPYVNNGCNPLAGTGASMAASCTQRTDPTKEDSGTVYGPYQAPFLPDTAVGMV